jgi:hypothetical protein
VGAVGVEERPYLADVRLRPHERHRDEIDPLVDAEDEIFPVLVGEARDGQRDVREGDALVIADPPTRDDAAVHLVVASLLYHERDHPVVHQDGVTGLELRQAFGRGHRHPLLRSRRGPGHEREPLPGLEVHALTARGAEGAEPDLGPLQVLKDCDGAAEARLGPADSPDHLGVLGVSAVREIEPGNVHARCHEAIEHLHAGGGRPDRTDDLRMAHCPVFSSPQRGEPCHGPLELYRDPHSIATFAEIRATRHAMRQRWRLPSMRSVGARAARRRAPPRR